MSQSTRPLDPALLEILKDLEERDTDRLFVTSPTRLVRGLRDGSAQLRPGRAGQSAAFRELLRVYREELAHALFAEGHRRLLAHCGEGLRFESRRRTGEDDLVPALDLALLPNGIGDSTDDDWREFLRDALLAHRGKHVSELFAASLALAPRDSTRIHWAAALASADCTSSARRVLRETEVLTTSALIASCAAQALGCMHWQDMQYDRARKCFERAADHDPSARDAGAFALAMALITNERSAVKDQIAFVKHAYGGETEELRRVEEDLMRMPIPREIRAQVTCEMLGPKEDSAGPAARIVLALSKQ